MKIAYITLAIAPEILAGGVGAKIKKQMTLWRQAGETARLFALSAQPVPLPDCEQFLFQPAVRLPLLKFLSREVSRSRALSQLIAAVRAYQPDIIYLRFGLFTFPLQRLFRVAPLVMEVNSNDLAEYRMRGLFFYWLNRLTRGISFSRASGLIFPTHELARMNQRYQQRFAVIANGVDLESRSPLLAPANDTPALALVVTPGAKWHGVDKLIRLAHACPDLTIHIAGYEAKDLSAPLPLNLRLHGFLNQDGLRSLLAAVDVAFGTLALHRKDMREACPLKTREALAYGIPLILAYEDTDLQNVNMETLLRLPNTENNVEENIKQIHDFAYQMRGQRVNLNLIAPLLDQRKKEAQRLAFFAQMIAEESLPPRRKRDTQP